MLLDYNFRNNFKSQNQPEHSNQFSSISPANSPQELQKLLSHLPLHTVPLHSLLRQLCPYGDCDFGKFEQEVSKLLPGVKNTTNKKLLKIVYNSLDKNHDGKIDVNELSNTMIMFYNPNSYKNDAEIWSKISKVNWVPVEDVRKYLKSLGVVPKLTENFISKVNIENNPNMTFAQFLRAKNDSVRTEIDKFLSKVPRSRSASHSPNIQRNSNTNINVVTQSPQTQRIDRVVVRTPVRNGQRQPRNSGSRRENTIILQQSPVQRTITHSNVVYNHPSNVSPLPSRPHVQATVVRPNIPLQQPNVVGPSPESPLPQSPRSITKVTSPFKNKGKARVVKAEILKHPGNPNQAPLVVENLALRSVLSPAHSPHKISHHESLNKPSTHTFNVSRSASPKPKMSRYSSVVSNTCFNPCSSHQPVLVKTKQIKADGRLVSPIRSPMRVFTTQRVSPGGQIVTTTTTAPVIHTNNPNPISQPIFQPSSHHINRSPISPISPNLQRIEVNRTPKYRKIVIGPNGNISHSRLTDYQSPNKESSASNPLGLPRNYAHLSSTDPTNLNGIRIRDNRNATSHHQNVRTPSPHTHHSQNQNNGETAPGLKHPKQPQNQIPQQNSRSISPNQRTLVKGQYKQINEGLNSDSNGKPNKPIHKNGQFKQGNSGLSFGNDQLKNFTDEDGDGSESRNVTPDKDTNNRKNTRNNESPQVQTKEDVQKLLENTNTPGRQKNKKNQLQNSKISYTPPKIPGVNTDLSNDQNKNPKQNDPGTEKSNQYFHPEEQIRGKINPQDEVLVKGFDRASINKRNVDPQAQIQKPIDNQQNVNNLNNQKQPLQPNQNIGNITQIKKKSPIKKKEDKPPIAANLNKLLSLRIPLGFNNIPAHKIAQKIKNHFQNHASKKSFSKDKFTDFVKSLDSAEDLSDKELEAHCGTLFRGLDYDGNGKLSRTEIANFLILSSQGDKESKIKAAFNLYDNNGNQKLDMGELTDYFLGVIKLSLIGKKRTAKQAKNLAAATAKKCFDQIDLNKDGSIGLQEFTEYILNGGDASASQVAMKEQQRQTIRMTKPRTTRQRNARAQNIHDVKKVIDRIRQGVPFQNIHISVALHYLRQDNPELYTIDKMKFRNFLKSLIKKQKISVKFRDGFDNIPALFFKVFDVNNNGILDKQELGVGLFILCGKNFIALVVFEVFSPS